MPEISVIIPTFNRLWALPKAIESCRNTNCQTEIIVVDDGSTDGTWEWLRSQTDVIAIRQENWGKDWAVNRAFDVAQGKFVRFLDSDDWLLADANDHQLALARETLADVVVAGYRHFNESTETEYIENWIECDDFVAQQLGECSSSHYSAYLIRKSFIEDIPHRQEFGSKDDRMFVIELAIKAPRIAVYDSPAFVHRHHGYERLQSRKGLGLLQNHLELVSVYRKALQILERKGELTKRRINATTKALWPLAHQIAYSNLDAACEIANWVDELDKEYKTPGGGALPFMYSLLGFRRTEKILWFRRLIVGWIRRRP